MKLIVSLNVLSILHAKSITTERFFHRFVRDHTIFDYYCIIHTGCETILFFSVFQKRTKMHFEFTHAHNVIDRQT